MSIFSKRQYIFIWAIMTIGSLLGGILSSAIVTAQSNRPQQTVAPPVSLQKWDYRVISGNPGTVEQGLEWAGNQGYEVAGFAATADEGGRQTLNVLLRHPKP